MIQTAALLPCDSPLFGKINLLFRIIDPLKRKSPLSVKLISFDHSLAALIICKGYTTVLQQTGNNINY